MPLACRIDAFQLYSHVTEKIRQFGEITVKYCSSLLKSSKNSSGFRNWFEGKEIYFLLNSNWKKLWFTKEIEDLYLPFKKKKKTKASVALKTVKPLAKFMNQKFR
jgi:hypothetical protein